MADDQRSVRDLLAASDSLSSDPALADAATRLFDFVQFLLDDDENVTTAGNLNGKARERLRARVDELLDPASLPATASETE